MIENAALNFRKAETKDQNEIWKIIQDSIERRRKDGSEQWQNGYPNLQTIEKDIQNNFGYVLTVNETVAVYVAIILNDEPAYEKIDGKWLTNGDFGVIHRVAISENFSGKGLAKKLFDYIEEHIKNQGIPSIKVDTNFDNLAMLKILENKGYIYCGEVFLAGGIRKAFEKVINI